MSTENENEKPVDTAGESAPEAESAVDQATDNESVETLPQEGELERALAELQKHKDAMLRMQADMDNQRKRQARELEKAHKYALDRFMNDLLPVRDSLERGLEACDSADDTVEALKEGKQLTLKVLTKVMQDHGLELVDPVGEVFNPEWHQAVSMQPTNEHEPNTVVTVIQKGYKLNDRLVRPAMVIVAASS